ncbi:uncharacterized protein CANTADRAFT_26588 [Suhomyces tanzawaensis NRRL Y-17324]|uniref:Uncharacterized protein n=1 Tax=Suhomyces tanzawaensis NRRL Y-17324 TaxID=984487 RepID=A0A1E4SGC1_9ASCO|nr:uncharacterized protein CANTADRAFT_26588 [Suhomyces tanzawaensis NRRL Y-17324]ODV78526.1 hypothetical protein CANTADRAFT_26588 [Suhomyces tanzawaensis NRRL Y-17324]
MVLSVFQTVQGQGNTGLEILLTAFVHIMAVLFMIKRIKGDVRLVVRVQVVRKRRRRRRL